MRPDRPSTAFLLVLVRVWVRVARTVRPKPAGPCVRVRGKVAPMRHRAEVPSLPAVQTPAVQ